MAGRADILKHMRAKHVGVFQSAAGSTTLRFWYDGQTHASLEHVGEPYAAPKRLDCKAKTADFDVKPVGSKCPDAQRKNFAGLVVDPKIVGEKAFKRARWQR